MFNSSKNPQEDPQKILQNTSNIINKGFIGWIIRLFMGKNMVDLTNKAFDNGTETIGKIKSSRQIAQVGMDATAEVLSIKDTGMTVNISTFVLILGLKVKPNTGSEFEVKTKVMVPRIAIPRIGDTIKIKYNPDDHSEIVLL